MEAEGPGGGPAHMQALAPQTIFQQSVCQSWVPFMGRIIHKKKKTVCAKVFFRVLFPIVETFYSDKHYDYEDYVVT